MPVKESSATIGDSGFASADRHAFEISPDVLRELFDGTVPAFGLLTECFQHYGVEVAAQPALQFSRLQAAALIAHILRSNSCLCLAFVRDSFFYPANDSARLFGLSFANHPLHFQKRLTRRAIGSMAGQQFEEQYRQRIDIGCGGDRVPANLLWAGVFRGHWTPVSSSNKLS